MQYYAVGKYTVENLHTDAYSDYGKQILATRSQTLSWSHFLELATIEDDTKRLFYEKITTAKHWSNSK